MCFIEQGHMLGLLIIISCLVSLCLGSRCVATLLNEMKRRGKEYRFGVISMCIGNYIFFSMQMVFYGISFDHI